MVRGDKTYAQPLPIIWWHMYFYVKVFLHIFVLRKTTLNLSQDNWTLQLSKKSELLLLELAWFMTFLFLLVGTIYKHHSTYTKLINFPQAATDTTTNLITVYQKSHKKSVKYQVSFFFIVQTHLNWSILPFLINCRDCKTAVQAAKRVYLRI